jgi:hypothetical protein
MTRSQAAGVAVLSRALMTAADLLLAVGAVVLIRRKDDRATEAGDEASGLPGGELGFRVR